MSLGAVMAQHKYNREHVTAYASLTVTPAEKNYATTAKECLAIVWAVNDWRTYLLGNHLK